MKNALFHTVAFLFFVWVSFPGCGGPQRPPGLPSLEPCVLSFTQEGKPLPGASVELFSEMTLQWPVTGTTDDAGKAVMVTYGQFKGAPVGDYVVIVSKTENERQGESEYSAGIMTVYSLIDPKFRKQESTSLRMSVKKGRNDETFELGKPMRVIVDKVTPDT